VSDQLADGERAPSSPDLTFPYGQGCTLGGMTGYDTLRALADDGNERALDRLADLADTHGDLIQLSDLLDEASMRAGELLTRRAAARRDLLELQRIADAGYEDARGVLDDLHDGDGPGARIVHWRYRSGCTATAQLARST